MVRSLEQYFVGVRLVRDTKNLVMFMLILIIILAIFLPLLSHAMTNDEYVSHDEKCWEWALGQVVKIDPEKKVTRKLLL